MSRLAALRERDFRLFFIGQSASLLGDGMVSVALSFAVLDLTGSATDLGYVLTAQTLPLVAVLLIGGTIADRLPRHLVMVAADVVRFASQGTMAIVLISGRATLWELVVLQAAHGAATAVFNPASTGLVPSTVSPERLQEANALRALAIAAGTIVGPALAGILIAVASPGWAIAFDAASFGVSAIFLSRLRPAVAAKPVTQSFVSDLREGWTEFRSRSWVWTIVLFASVCNMFSAAFLVLGPVVARQSLGGPTAWAVIMAAAGIGSFVGGVVALRFQPVRPLLVATIAATLYALPMLGLAAHLPTLGVAGLALISGASPMVFNTLWETTLQRQVPQAALSRVDAYDWFGSLACRPIGQAASGPIAARFGVHPALWAAGVCYVFLTVSALAVPDVRRMRSDDPAPAPVQELNGRL